MKNKIKNTLKGINSRLDEAENQTSSFEEKVGKKSQSEQQEEKNNFKK